MNRTQEYIATGIIGAAIGFISGWQGISRDDLLLVLLLVTGLAANQKIAAGTVLLSVVFPISIGAVWEYYKRGDVDFTLGIILTLTYIVTATLGAKMNYVVSKKTTALSIIIVEIISALYFTYDYLQMK
jgi:uncharacterized membrane protein YfcA